MKLAWNRSLLLVLWIALALPAPGLADPLPESAFIKGVRGHAQSYTLSCESRSAVDWAAFWGVSISEREFVRKLPRSDDPDVGFVGNPNGPWGFIPPYSYGVHAQPVAKLLNKYGLSAQARKGLKWDDLRTEIAAGRPVIVWIVGQMWKGVPVKYTASDGHTTWVAGYEHTMILTGYNTRSVQVIDAYSGRKQTYPLRTFLASWATLGRMAVTGGRTMDASKTSKNEARPAKKEGAWQQAVYLAFVTGGASQLVSSAVERPASPASQSETYTVRRGDYLKAVAGRFGLNWQTLARLNGIYYPYVIYPGQVLRLR